MTSQLERLTWIMQTIHQAHADHDTKTWETCQSTVCQEGTILATELKGQIPVPDAIFGRASQMEITDALYLCFIISESGQPTTYIHTFSEQEAVDRAKSVYGFVVPVPILHDFRKPGQSS